MHKLHPAKARLIGKYAMAFLYIAAGINHFIHPAFYVHLVPDYLPFPALLNVLSGIAEISLAVFLCIAYTQKAAAVGIAVLLLLFLTVHVDMLQKSIASASPINLAGAIIRILLQPLLIWWSLYYAARPRPSTWNGVVL